MNGHLYECIEIHALRKHGLCRLNFNLRSKKGLAGTPSGCVNIMQATHRGYLP